jgi:sulfonate transport system substrate-binding protein
MPRRLLHIPLLLLALVASLALAACGSEDEATATSETPAAAASTSAAPDLSNVTLRAAQIGAALQSTLEFAGEEDTPYKIEWSVFDAAPPLLQALQADAADIGIASDQAVANAVAADAPIKAVALSASAPAGFKLLVPADSPLRSVADLRGKQIGVFKGSAGEAFVFGALEKAGIAGDAKTVNVTPPQGAAAFNSGQLDAWAIWEPMASSTILGSRARVLADGEGAFDSLSFLAATDEALADPAKAAAIGDFLERLARSSAYREQHLDEWPAAFAKTYRVPLEVAEKAGTDTGTSYRPLDADAIARIDRSLEIYEQIGVITRPVDPETFFVTDFNEQIERGLSGAPAGD